MSNLSELLTGLGVIMGKERKLYRLVLVIEDIFEQPSKEVVLREIRNYLGDLSDYRVESLTIEVI